MKEMVRKSITPNKQTKSSVTRRTSPWFDQKEMPTRSSARVAALTAVAALSAKNTGSAVTAFHTPARICRPAVVTPEKIVKRKLSFSKEDDTGSSPAPRRSNSKKTKTKNASAAAAAAAPVVAPRTESFAAVTAATWHHLPEQERSTPVHTLIVGTHPSQASLKENAYYAFPTK